MADVYWYISADKVKSLKTAGLKWDKLAFKFNLKFLEIDTGVAFDKGLIGDVKSLKKKLAKDSTVVPFEDLKLGKQDAIFSFEGEASRMRTQEALWIGTQKRNSALLLVGAPRNLAGQSELKEGFMSPSLDPMAAVRAMIEGKRILTLLPALTYAWRRVMEDAISSDSYFPRVEGLAVFAGLFHPGALLIEGMHRSKLDRIVLGSPIYVRQVG